ncbi:leucine-rich repeat domain-containing protein [Cyclobacterium marinum]|uniref:leucine-rich repeat domain-containing protein n=1 Tax=Cyclobacterium marinum TaxID=104 RepID=UPI0011EDB8C3|nr:leucine-rich repeat domain-containing protein [Cyclobacterium marinum]MBI0399072.1 leucine-rich repeat domain-containing protein [Cyclobacterium marinum]
MTGIKVNAFILILFFCNAPLILAQDLGGYTKQEIKEFSQQAEDQVRFLQYFLNTVGSGETSARDKDVIIRESYRKIFRDENVQIEDDLLLDRQVITNKSIVSYLKDIEFFFKDAAFEFKIKEVKPKLNDNDELFFEISLDRTLTGLGLENENIENTKPRYVEINLDRDSNELKIASIYTTKLSRDEELLEWWSTLSLEWETLLREKFDITEDSVQLDMLYKISALDTLDLSGNKLLVDIAPIHVFRDLKYVDISRTQIKELSPISNITFLSYLDISNTPTDDIQFIKYSDKLTYLNISGTKVTNIDELTSLKNLKTFKAAKTPLMGFGVLDNFKNIETLDLEESGFNNIENLKNLSQLKVLNIKGNYLINFGFLSELKKLEEINLEETNILDLSPLASLPSLWWVNINGTEVSQLDPINGSGSIKRIYADRTSISENAAEIFIRANRGILLIHNVENLQTWWQTLPDGWNQVLVEKLPALGQKKPTIETLSSLVNMDSLNLSNSKIKNLRPALKFKSITFLSLENTMIEDLSPLAEMKNLLHINGDYSAVNNLNALQELTGLKRLSFVGTSVESVEPLKSLPSLEYINLDNTKVPKWDVQELASLLPQTNVIFRSEALESWWSGLNQDWKQLISDNYSLKDNPDTWALHKATASSKMEILGANVINLEPLLVFFNLKELIIKNVPLQDPSAISRLEMLQELQITESPFRDLNVVAPLVNLETLNVSNTAVSELEPLNSLERLKHLNLSGTNISNLKGLEMLYDLRTLDIASTGVRSLKPITHLINLESLVCFNTRLSNRNVEKFKAELPNCDVRYY